jgi:5-methylcytosine-specific restriction protein B
MAAIDDLAQIISNGFPAEDSRDGAAERTRETMKALFGERYYARSPHAERVVYMAGEDNIPFAGFVHQESPSSGIYGGMSLIWFPRPAVDGQPGSSLFTFVCGTRGLSPDESILGRPGHVRHLQALRRHLHAAYGVDAWTKQDPANLSQGFPKFVAQKYPQFDSAIRRYGSHIYCAVEVPSDPLTARSVVAAFLDLYAWERGWSPMKAAQSEFEKLQKALRAQLFPRIEHRDVVSLLEKRLFVVLQGPPGTGKTRLAQEILERDFGGNGMVVQFHPAVSYETFVAGISPAVEKEELRFSVSPGWLVQAVRQARSRKYLLVIDEINRADLGRVLGEAIYLLEPREILEGRPRSVTLPHLLEDGTRDLKIPHNLFILGTMNTADRSIAILDMAVRRRFAFVDLWPNLDIVEAQGIDLATESFGRLLEIFAQYAPDDALPLLPGHSYFLAHTTCELMNRLRFELMPLLREYLQEGRLGACESELRAYIDWLEGETDSHGSE